MNSKSTAQRINWRQAAAEMTLIIAGVLLALAVDAWWEEKSEREAEVSYLRALNQDFAANRDGLQAQIILHENLITAGDEVLNLIKSGLEESSDEFFFKINNGLYFFQSWTPVVGAYDNIMNSGELLYIENRQIRNELSGFQRRMELIQQMEELQTRNFYDRQSPFLAKYQDVNSSNWSTEYKPPTSPFLVDAAPFESLEYWNLVVEWIYVHSDVITQYRFGVADCNRIIDLIEIELADKT